MSVDKSNTIVPIIVAVIAVIGTIAVALINNHQNQSVNHLETSKDTVYINPTDSDAPRFHDLSTFCDTLNYFIEQNLKGYSWLKLGKGNLLEDNSVEYAAKINLLGYRTNIEEDKFGVAARVNVINTYDSLEAKRFENRLIEKLALCLDDFDYKTYQTSKGNRLIMTITEYTKGIHQLEFWLSQYIPEYANESPLFSLELYIQKAN